MPLGFELLEAYRGAEYVVFAEPDLVLKVGEPNPDLDAFLEQDLSATAAFVTACNPRGERKSHSENEHANDRLRVQCAMQGYRCLAGEGRDPKGRWPAEASFLVLDIPLDKALELGQAFKQNAIVFCEKGRLPELVVLAD